MKNIASVSVTYNPELELLNRQIDSLTDEVQTIIVVDNGSQNFDELKKFIDQKTKESKTPIQFIPNNANMGLGYAQNVGLKKALETGMTDMLLLDQDSVLQENFIKHLLESRSELEVLGINVGAIGPIYFSEVTNEIYPITKFWGPFIQRIEPADKPEEASFLIASGCLINADVLKNVGLMDEDLFIDCIDVDWSFRAQAKGYKLYASPKARMMHTIGEKRMSVAGRSIAVHSPQRRYYLFRNSVFMVRNKNIPVGYKVREIVFNTLRLIVYFSVSRDRLKYLKYSFTGFKDGINGVGGKCAHTF